MVKSPKRPVLEDSDDELDNLELDSDDNFQAQHIL